MITVVGLGPGDLDRTPEPVARLLADPANTIVARTRHHPAAAQLAAQRRVIFCDDLYEAAGTFEEVYESIVARVMSFSEEGPVVYVVPGSPLVGEFAVRSLVASTENVAIIPGESFVDAVLDEMGYDPLDRGLQLLNAHELPDPLILDKPTIVGHLDRPEVLAETCAAIAGVVQEGTEVTVLSGLGTKDARVATTPPEAVDPNWAGLLTSLYVDTAPGGLVGAVATMRRLRAECPWDRSQTHVSLAKNLVEECYELVDAIARLDHDDEPDWTGLAELEGELGDVLLQVLFHAAIGREAGVFDIDSIAETLRQKLVRRHPHVFGDVVVTSADEVKENWDRIKAEEVTSLPSNGQGSVLDGVPAGMPALGRAAKLQNRAAKVGFDWEGPGPVLSKVREEVEELAAAMEGGGDATHELGDVLFSLVNLARHLGEDPELALRSANHRFEERFRSMEGEGPLEGLGLDALDERWERAKGARGTDE